MQLNMKLRSLLTFLSLTGLGLALPLAAFSRSPQLGWISLPSLPDPIGYGSMFAGVLHGQLVAGGGSQWDKPVWLKGNKRYSDKIWALSSPDGAWMELPIKLPTPRGHFPVPLHRA